MLQLSARLEGEAIEAQMRALAGEQFPFAMALALTKTASGAKKEVFEQTKRDFEVRASNFLQKGIRIKPAQKRDVQSRGYGTAEVYTSPRLSTFLPDHIGGETRTPRGRKRAVPGPDLKNYRTKTGRVKRNVQPSTLLKDYQPWKGGRSIGRSRRRLGKPFIMPTKRDSLLIIARRRRDKIEKLWYLVDEVKIQQGGWEFYPAVMKYVNRNFERHAKDALDDALNPNKDWTKKRSRSHLRR